MKRYILFIFIYAFYLLPITSEEKQADCDVEALASLLFHVNSQLHINETENELPPLTFEPYEVETLWNKVTGINDCLNQANKNYWLWFDDPSIENQLALKKCAQCLSEIWHSFQEKTDSQYYPLWAGHLYSNADFTANPLLTKKIKSEIAPHLLPATLSITSIVNQIFSSSRPTFSADTLIQSGFNILHKQPRSFIVVASHPNLPEWLFKLYYDTELRMKNNVPGWKWFVRRCEGAKGVKSVIERKKIKHFKVPEKYIYVLPASTMPPRNSAVDPKLAVLIVQDMQLADEATNYFAWKNLVTPEILDELYIIISRANGSSYRPDNIPYTKSGHFAFIDTEYPRQDPDFNSIRPYLSEEMWYYWDQLVRKGGPDHL